MRGWGLPSSFLFNKVKRKGLKETTNGGNGGAYFEPMGSQHHFNSIQNPQHCASFGSICSFLQRKHAAQVKSLCCLWAKTKQKKKKKKRVSLSIIHYFPINPNDQVLRFLFLLKKEVFFSSFSPLHCTNVCLFFKVIATYYKVGSEIVGWVWFWSQYVKLVKE